MVEPTGHLMCGQDDRHGPDTQTVSWAKEKTIRETSRHKRTNLTITNPTANLAGMFMHGKL